MQKKIYLRWFLLAVLLLLAAWLSSGCEQSRNMTEKPSPDWSRGVEIGQYVVGSVGMVVNPGTGQVNLIWPFDVGEGTRFRFIQLDQQADREATVELEFPGYLRSPRLLLANHNHLHLFWSSRMAAGKWELWYTLLDEGGMPTMEPFRVSQAGENVGYYQATPDRKGGVIVAWGTGGQGPVELSAIDGAGSIQINGVQVLAEGESPAVRVDQNNAVHLAWQQGTQLYYASVALENLAPVSGVPVADLVIGTGDSLTGPVLGLEKGWVYIFWSLLSRSGLQAGSARTEYTAFPVGQPSMMRPKDIWVMPVEEPPYVPYAGDFGLAQLTEPPQVAYANTDFVESPNTSALVGDQLGMALSANQLFRLDQYMQIAVGVFDDGKYLGYSFATKSEQFSDDPRIDITSDGQLYLAWREGAGGRFVYFATTSQPAIRALDHLGTGDFINAFLRGGIESFVSVALTPVIGFGWLLPGLIIMGIWKLLRENEEFSDPLTWIPFILAMVTYEFIKFVTLPTIVTYVPFSAWLSIPDGIETGLQVGVPIAITIVALLIANYVRQRRSSSAVLFYGVFTIADAVLSLAVYGVNFLGVF